MFLGRQAGGGRGKETGITAHRGRERPLVGARFRRYALKVLALAVSSAVRVTAAQDISQKALPDAPTPWVANIPETGQNSASGGMRSQRPPAASPLSVREKYRLAYLRVVSPQALLKSAFVSGFELAAGTGPDFPTNGWGAFGQRVGFNALSLTTTTFFDTAFVPALAVRIRAISP